MKGAVMNGVQRYFAAAILDEEMIAAFGGRKG
jgi:hypothetical protein